MIRRDDCCEHRPACSWLERSRALPRAAARGWQLLPIPPRLGRAHGRPFGRDGARGHNIRAQKSVEAASAARPVSQLWPTRWAASTGLPPHDGHFAQPNQPLLPTGRGALSPKPRLGRPRPAAEGQVVRHTPWSAL